MPNVRSDDPQTSYDAFDAIAPRLTDMHRRFIDIFTRNGIHGATPWEIQCETGIIYNTVWRRLSELKEIGVLINTESTRPNDRNFEETVVVLRSLVSDLEYISPRSRPAYKKLREENNFLRRLLAEVTRRWRIERNKHNGR